LTRFIVETPEINGDTFVLVGEDAKHCNVLRLNVGDKVVICDGNGMDYQCIIENVSKSLVHLQIVNKVVCENEPFVNYSIYCAFPKGDKAEHIIQKVTELGAGSIYFFPSKYCVAKYNADNLTKKRERWQKIAREAAQQSQRGVVPTVDTFESFAEAIKHCAGSELSVFCYENESSTTINDVRNNAKTVSIITGSEGGFSEEEVEYARSSGCKIVTLGKRILRCETAPPAVLAAFTIGGL